MRRIILFVAELCLIVPMGLAALAGSAQAVAATDTKPALPSQVLAVPLVRQEEDFSCGPAALSSVLKYFRVWDGREQQLYKLLETSAEQGTLPENLAQGARRFGLTAAVEKLMTIDRLRALLDGGRLVILELQAWRDDEGPMLPWSETWDDGHYVVLVGLDETFAYFMDPSTRGAYTYLPLVELLERWHDRNVVRKDPREQHDFQLGVVIGGPVQRAPRRPATRRLLRLD